MYIILPKHLLRLTLHVYGLWYMTTGNSVGYMGILDQYNIFVIVWCSLAGSAN